MKKPKSEQDVFNMVVKHFAKQGRPSKGLIANGYNGQNEIGCAYRGSNGCMCAAGIFLPDNIAKHHEGMSIGYVIDSYEELKHLKPFEPLLMELQQIHDEARDLEDLKGQLTALATSNDNIIDASAIDKIKKWDTISLL